MDNGPYPNLARRPAKPALLNGRVQKACRRALIASGAWSPQARQPDEFAEAAPA